MVKTDLTAARLRELLNYNPDTGVFTRRVSLNRRVRVGEIAGTQISRGYWVIRVDNVKYLGHRLAWLYVHGIWPSDQIDHINGQRSDNRIANLREATNSENMQNSVGRKRKTPGKFGTYYRKDNGLWGAAIRRGSVRKHLGFFETSDQAHAAYLSAKLELDEFNPVPRDAK